MENNTSIFDNSSFNAVFFSFLITSVIGCILKIISMMYKSKCSTVKFCCITVIRDVAVEERVDRIPANTENNNI